MPLFKSLKELDQTEGTVQLRQRTSLNRHYNHHLHYAVRRGLPLLTDEFFSAVDTSNGTIVLVPHPNPYDPNDPLRWPRWKKHVAFTAVCAFTFLTNFAIGGLAPAFCK